MINPSSIGITEDLTQLLLYVDEYDDIICVNFSEIFDQLSYVIKQNNS